MSDQHEIERRLREADALAVRSNADRVTRGYAAQGVEFGNDVGLADARRRSSGMSAPAIGRSLIEGAGAVADKWYRFGL